LLVVVVIAVQRYCNAGIRYRSVV